MRNYYLGKCVIGFFLLGLGLTQVASAASYSFTTGSSANYPTCTGGGGIYKGWSVNGSTWTCSGSVIFAAGDKVNPSSARTLNIDGGVRFSGGSGSSVGDANTLVHIQTTYGEIRSDGAVNFNGNLTTTSGSINLTNPQVTQNITGGGVVEISNGTVIGSVSAKNNLTLSNGVSVGGNVSSQTGSISMSGGSVGGGVSASNAVTLTNSVDVGGNVKSNNGTVTLTGGTVAGSVRSDCCLVKTSNVDIGNGVSSGSSTVEINGGMIAGAISSAGGAGILIKNAEVSSGSITATNVPILIDNSSIGDVGVPVVVTGNNTVTISNHSVIYGSVTAAQSWSALTISSDSRVYGVCSTNSSASNANPDKEYAYLYCTADLSAGQCARPSSIPSGVVVTCYCDDFSRGTLNPSPIFNSDWLVSTSDSTGVLPRIVNSSYLRLTENTKKNAKAVTVPGYFPAAGNYISIEFRHYAYAGGGDGADGMAVVLSNYAQPAKPGAFGGSLGYAQKGESPVSDCTTAGGCAGFQGGWLGVAIDEFGGFRTNDEGRSGGVSTRVRDIVAVRGSGSGMTGYNYLYGTGALNPGIDSGSNRTSRRPGDFYQVVVDARESAKTKVSVRRDSTSSDRSAYQYIVPEFDIYQIDKYQAPLPDNWKVSFTGSTGSSTNYHEIDQVRICAQVYNPPSTGIAKNFAVIDEGYGFPQASSDDYMTGHLYMKLQGVPFKLSVAAIDSKNQIDAVYAGAPVLKIVDNQDGVCQLVGADRCSAACGAKPAISYCGAGAASCSQVLNFKNAANKGQVQTADLVIHRAFKKLAVVVSDGSTTACSVDEFSVRPQGINSVVSSLDVSNGKKIKAGVSTADTITAVITGSVNVDSGYSGVLSIDASGVVPELPATEKGELQFPAADNPKLVKFPPAISSMGRAQSTLATDVQYSEVGNFIMQGGGDYSAIYDDTWTSVDSVSDKGDCVLGSFSNAKNGDGKYGCNVGLLAPITLGRFIPDHFEVSAVALMPRQVVGCTGGGSDFNYMDEEMKLSFTLKAMNASSAVTKNYGGALAKLVLKSDISTLNPGAANLPPHFSALSDRLTARSFNPITWPAPGADGGKVMLSGFVTISSLNGPSQSRVRPDGPYDDLGIGIAPVDEDGVQLASYDVDMDNSGANERALLAKTRVRFGILRMSSTYGSELLSLSVPVEARYWNGTGFILNKDDACTIPALAAANVAWTPEGVLLSPQIKPSTSQAGKGVITLPTPDKSKRSAFRICLDISADGTCEVGGGGVQASFGYLTGPWDGSSRYDRDPSARAVFGLSRGAHLYYRENY